MDFIQESASKCARCPICFEALHLQPASIGALVCSGKRVEPALYHKLCVCDESGKLRFSYSETADHFIGEPMQYSPMSRRAVDGFLQIPPLHKPLAWAQFLDWRRMGKCNVKDVAIGIAAVLPVDEESVEQFVQKLCANTGGNCKLLDLKDIRFKVLPYLRKHVRKLVTSSAANPAPEICRASSDADFVKWFEHWDKQKKGSLPVSTLGLALATCFQNLGVVDERSKDSIVTAFLSDLGYHCPDNLISIKIFTQNISPHLKANLPASLGVRGDSPFDPKGPLRLKLVWMKTGSESIVVLPAGATVTTLRDEAQRKFRHVLSGRHCRVFFMAKELLAESTALGTLSGIMNGSAVQVLAGGHARTVIRPEKVLPVRRDAWGRPLTDFRQDLSSRSPLPSPCPSASGASSSDGSLTECEDWDLDDDDEDVGDYSVNLRDDLDDDGKDLLAELRGSVRVEATDRWGNAV